MTSYNGASYSWQGRELTKVTSGSNTYSYKYDADGIRTSKTVNGTKTEFFLNGSQILARKTGDTTMLFFYDRAISAVIDFFEFTLNTITNMQG